MVYNQFNLYQWINQTHGGMIYTSIQNSYPMA